MGRSKVKDFDPESLLDPAPSSSEDEASDFESEQDEQTGREHYAQFGKSKLRKKEVVPLGPQYSGTKINRDTLEAEDSDDPFSREYDIDDSEDEGEEEEAKGGRRGGVINGGITIGSESEDDELDEADLDENMNANTLDNDGEEEEDDEGSIDELDEEDDDDDDDEGSSRSYDDEGPEDQTAKLREMMKDTSIVTSAISQAAKKDVEKGNAIKDQRKTFDTLLNTRIRLQKALISTNSLASGTDSKSSTPPETAIEAAEMAALNLLNNLSDLRSTLDEARAGQKRKRVNHYTLATPSSTIWSQMLDLESLAQSQRDATLEKWSARTRGATLSSSKGRLNTNVQQTLTDVLRAQLHDSARLIARTQIPRSCAPIQAAANVQFSPAIYDDADFYGLLLKELLESRSNELNANGSASEFVVQAPWQVAREAKTRKLVDTKASKGRKMRYAVHEKLQNFMAPEDRGSWGERQRDELFGGLFGRASGLREDDGSSEEDVEAEEEGLVLFRS